jgi:hypothetical protein
MTERRSPRESGTPPLRFPPSLGGGGSASRALSQAHRASDYRVRPKPGGRDLDEGVIRSRGRRQPPTNAFPGCGRGRPRSQGGRQSRTWRCARPRARSPQGDERRCIPQPPADTVPGCGRGRPRSQGVPRQSRTWRCARPRARSPQGDGEQCIRQPPADTAPGCGRDARAPREGPIPDLEMRSSPSAEPAGRREAMHTPTAGRHGPRMRARRPRSQGGATRQSRTWRCARPRARSPQGDERRCIRQPPADTVPGCGRDARAPREGPIPDLEMRSSPSAEPAGRREAMHTPTASRHGPRMRARTPALPGGAQSRTWRCARPRARSPQGDERRCIPQPPADTVPGCGRGRPRSQGGRPANPGPGDALVPERGARRATGSNAYPNRRPTRPPDAGETPALPGGAQSRTWRCARPRARSPQGDERRCIRQPPADTAPGCGRDARAPREGEPAETLRLGSVAAA